MRSILVFLSFFVFTANTSAQSVSSFDLNCYRCKDLDEFACKTYGIDLKGTIVMGSGGSYKLSIEHLKLEAGFVSRGYRDDFFQNELYDLQEVHISSSTLILSSDIKDYDGKLVNLSFVGQSSDGKKFDALSEFKIDYDGVGPRTGPFQQICELSF